jgi:hypothetical protein
MEYTPSLSTLPPPPPKWTHIGTKKNIWSDTVESTRKDVERCFGILKKRWRCLINLIELQDPDHIERLFTDCAILHNILLDYDGIDDWEKRMKKAKFNGNDDATELNSVLKAFFHREGEEGD